MSERFIDRTNEHLLVNPDSSSENIKKPLFISLVRGAKMLDVTFCGLGRKIFAVDDWARAFEGAAGSAASSDFESIFGLYDGQEKMAAVTDRGRRLTISQLLTLMVLIGFMTICSLALTSFFLSAASTTTILAALLPDFASTFFGFKSLMPSTMLSLLNTLVSARSASLFLTVVGSATFDSSCCASSWAHDRISCSFSTPLEVHKISLVSFQSEFFATKILTKNFAFFTFSLFCWSPKEFRRRVKKFLSNIVCLSLFFPHRVWIRTVVHKICPQNSSIIQIFLPVYLFFFADKRTKRILQKLFFRLSDI